MPVPLLLVVVGAGLAPVALSLAGPAAAQGGPVPREQVLAHVAGNQTQAAEILGINRATLRKKLKQYDLL